MAGPVLAGHRHRVTGCQGDGWLTAITLNGHKKIRFRREDRPRCARRASSRTGRRR